MILGWVYFYVLEVEDVLPRPLLSLIMLMRKSSEGNGAAGGHFLNAQVSAAAAVARNPLSNGPQRGMPVSVI